MKSIFDYYMYSSNYNETRYHSKIGKYLITINALIFFIITPLISFCEIDSLKIEPTDTISTIIKTDSIKIALTDTISIFEKSDSLCQEQNDTISIIGVGDMMFGTNFPSEIYLPPSKSAIPLIEPVANILNDADVTFGNLEGVFLNSGKVEKKCKDTTKCFAFRMPENFSKALEIAGFDILSLANNHINDFGKVGINKTTDLLDSININHAGSYQQPYCFFTRNNIKFGTCAFSTGGGALNINDIDKAKRIIQSIKDSCEILIVSFHGGAEGADHQHVLKSNELFLGEERGNVYEFAHAVIDAGADVVFGHGPHVTRAIDIYKKRFIIYSLGNFCTYGRFNLRGPNGIAPIVKIHVNNNGEFLDGIVIATQQKGAGGVIPDNENKVIKKIKELTSIDLPETNILIDQNGYMQYKQ